MSPDPATHRCTIGQLDYTLVDHGTIRCAIERGGCGRTWRFVERSGNDPGGWRPSPPPLAARYAGRRSTKLATQGVGPW